MLKVSGVSSFSSFDFIAKLAKIDTFIDRVRGIVGKVTSKISSVLDPIIKKAVGFVRPFLDKLTGKPSSTTAVKPGSVEATTKPINGTFGKETFTAGKEQHSAWVKVTNNQPELWIASTPREATAQIDALETEAKTKNILPLVAPSIKVARATVNTAKLGLQKKLAAGVVDDTAMSRYATEAVNGIEYSVKDVFDQIAKGTSESDLKLNLDFKQLKHEFWSGGRPTFSSATKAALGTLSADEDRRHIQAFDDIFKNTVAAITGKTFTDAGAWLTGKGFKPVKLELQALKNALKAYLNKEFSRLENIWVGEKRENQQKGSDAQAADKALKKAKPGTPEYETALVKRSAAMVDPAKGTVNGKKISSREQGWIDQIQDANVSLPRYVNAYADDRLKTGTLLFLQAGVVKNNTEISQRGLGDFSNKMDSSEFSSVNSNLQIAVKIIYELNRILKG